MPPLPDLPSLPNLEDTYGRRFTYLRLSVTDACNFKCVYCLPQGYKKPKNVESDLTLTEIQNLVGAFAEMGVWKFRLTGGEPTLRRDLLEIAQVISETPGVRKIALSTNGYRLKSLAKNLKQAGVTALNISIDSLDRGKFSEITGVDKLDEILEGVDAALQEKFSSIKINAVLLDGWNNQEFDSFLNWIQNKPVTVRFIELMPTGQNQPVFKKHHAQSTRLQERLTQLGWTQKPREQADGPAVEFEHSDFTGNIGMIAPYSKDFCKTCNRLRITSRGALRMCLFAEGNTSVRHLLQERSQREELQNLLRSLLTKKESSHYLPEGRYGNNLTFSAIGG